PLRAQRGWRRPGESCRSRGRIRRWRAYGGCSSMVEHWTVTPGVAGSSPVSHPIQLDGLACTGYTAPPSAADRYGSVAQLAEQWPLNLQVEDPNPSALSPAMSSDSEEDPHPSPNRQGQIHQVYADRHLLAS